MRQISIFLTVFLLFRIGEANPQPDQDSLRKALTRPTLTEGQARLLLLRSLLIPGWGEYQLAKPNRALVFNTVEVVGWVSYYFWLTSGKAGYKDMQAFAVRHAGIDPDGKDDYYYVDIGNYDNIYAYNDQKLRDRQVDLLYPLTPDYYWAWDSAQNRQQFDRLRIRSAAHRQYATFALIGLAVNRIVSMVDIMVLTRNHLQKSAVELESQVVPTRDGAYLSLEFRF